MTMFNKYFELLKFQSGYRTFYLEIPKGYSRKIIDVQTAWCVHPGGSILYYHSP